MGKDLFLLLQVRKNIIYIHSERKLTAKHQEAQKTCAGLVQNSVTTIQKAFIHIGPKQDAHTAV